MASLFAMFRITWHFIDPDCVRACYKLDIGEHVKRELRLQTDPKYRS